MESILTQVMVTLKVTCGTGLPDFHIYFSPRNIHTVNTKKFIYSLN